MNPTVTREEWRATRDALLAEEKALTRARDALTAKIRAMPWVEVDTDYKFQTPDGEKSLRDLFEGKSQLLVYHFMLGPDWEAGCKSCSFWADNFGHLDVHLSQRDVTFLAIARAPLEKIEQFKARMGWGFRWVSSFGSSFNEDFGVSHGEDESPGISIFSERDGKVFHTYFTTGRGLEVMNNTYQVLDLVPRGRHEDPANTMSWVKRHDEY